MNEIKLLPCPFCGNANIELYSKSCESFAVCVVCGAKSGTVFTGGAQVVKLWNTRVNESSNTRKKKTARTAEG